MKEVGGKIRELRIKKNIQQNDLSSRIGLSNTYLSKLEKGLKPLNLKNLYKIADALDVEPSDILSNGERDVPIGHMNEEWVYVVEELKKMGYSPGDVYLKIHQDFMKNKGKDRVE